MIKLCLPYTVQWLPLHCKREHCSKKGRLIIYLSQKYKYNIKYLNNYSTIWVGQFIEKIGTFFPKNILGNICSPPRDNIDNYKNFIDELAP